MEQLKRHMWLAAALAMSLPLSAAADGNQSSPPKAPTLSELGGKIDALDDKIDALVREIGIGKVALRTDVTLAAKRGVAILQVVPRTSGRNPSNRTHYFSPRYFVMGSTIQGFHHTVAFGTEIIPTNSNNHTLPAGSYMFELQQPRPPDDDARCAVPQPFRGHPNIVGAITGELHSVYEDAMIYEPAFGSTTATSTTSTSTNPSLGSRCRVMRIHSGGIRKLDSGAAVLKFDGTQGFEVAHKIPASWITATRSVSSYYGSVRITKLE